MARNRAFWGIRRGIWHIIVSFPFFFWGLWSFCCWHKHTLSWHIFRARPAAAHFHFCCLFSAREMHAERTRSGLKRSKFERVGLVGKSDVGSRTWLGMHSE
ncbi:uncharacterized protein BKA78DRAFT_123508 [Phyllosticta capitalensis]|uniref:uncharacterized protein n=1 Tax=Phyllosticta capitalensis TaxID=121624 RepID=UPI00313085FB